jgi:hypothetical protein
MSGEPIVLKAMLAPLGWAIVAKNCGENYLVEAGLKDPKERLEYWNRNHLALHSAISKVRLKEKAEAEGRRTG